MATPPGEDRESAPRADTESTTPARETPRQQPPPPTPTPITQPSAPPTSPSSLPTPKVDAPTPSFDFHYPTTDVPQIRQAVSDVFTAELQSISEIEFAKLSVMRRTWQTYCEEHGRENVIPATTRPPEYVEYDKLTSEEKARVTLSEEKRRAGVVRSAAESAGEFAKSSPYACQFCGKLIKNTDSLVVFRHTDGGTHLGHVRCCEAVIEGGEAVSCGECAELLASQEYGTSPYVFMEEARAFMGHGADSPGENTFVPLGMTVYTYANPGWVVGMDEIMAICANPLTHKTRATFEQGAEIPNIRITPYKSHELELGKRAWLSGRRRPSEAEELSLDEQMQKYPQSEDVTFIEEDTALCTTPDKCRRPVHTCAGLLNNNRGIPRVYIGSCFGSGGLGADPDPIKAGYSALVDKFIAIKKKNDALKALNVFNDMHEGTRSALLTFPAFVHWYDAALRTEIEEKIPSRPKEADGTPAAPEEETGVVETKGLGTRFVGLTFGSGRQWRLAQLDGIHGDEESTVFDRADIQLTATGGQLILFQGSAAIFHPEGSPQGMSMILRHVVGGAETTAAWAGQVPYRDEHGAGYEITATETEREGAWFAPFGSTLSPSGPTYVFIGRDGHVRFVAPTTLITVRTTTGLVTRPITDILGTALPRSMPLDAFGIDVVHTPQAGTATFTIAGS
ncbi:putative adhesin [Streptomyces sp. NPDC048419]|uniref:putative adhesin n=1 Tax=Streptomyces sp. NPDC048419 TaxID=3365547 RepID=UPI00371288B7